MRVCSAFELRAAEEVGEHMGPGVQAVRGQGPGAQDVIHLCLVRKCADTLNL